MPAQDHLGPQFQRVHPEHDELGVVPLKTRMPVLKTRMPVDKTHTFLTPAGITYHTASANGKRLRHE